MALLTQRHGQGWAHAAAEELDRQLREGDGLMWAGDPRLDLRIAIASAPRAMLHPITQRRVRAGDELFRRYEVYRHNEDGTEESIGHWRIEEFDRILFDVVGMKASYEGKREDVISRIDAANAEVERKNSDTFRDAYGTMLDHSYRLAHTLAGEPGTTFYQVGNAGVDKNGKKV